MKNLKHYFVSPKGSAEHSECVLVNGNVLSDESLFEGNVSNSFNSVEVSVNSDYSKKNKRKRKGSKEHENYVDPVFSETVFYGQLSKEKEVPTKKPRKSDVSLNANDTKGSRKAYRGKSVESGSSMASQLDERSPERCFINSIKGKRKSDRISKIDNLNNESSDNSRNSGDSFNICDVPNKDKVKKKKDRKKENHYLEDMPSNVADPALKELSTPENSKNILNYFNKVDKLPDINEKPRVIKVEALVHVPCSGSSEKYTPKSLKKKRSSKRKDLKVDYDLITLEDADEVTSDLKTETSKSWQMRIHMTDESNHSVESDSISRAVTDELRGGQKLLVSVQTNQSSSDAEENNKRKLNADQAYSNHKKILPTCEDNDVVFVNEIKTEKPKGKVDGTLSSFFQFGKRTSSLTSEQKSAKQKFLNSGAPELIKKKTEAWNKSQGKDAPFPEKSHVQQKDRMNIMWNLHPTNYDFSYEVQCVKSLEWSSILPIQSYFKDELSENMQPCNSSSLKDLKKELNLYPISCWYKELKRLKKGNENSMWTERYRPHLAATFLANMRSICKLKAWLTELKENSRADSCNSSGDEFIKDDEKEHIEKKTVALLSGQPGTGKTAAVYAIAEEIGYHVLEINASHNRSGKRILNEFSEAMQSHKVGVSKLNFSRTKKKSENPKRSLVLVEDADLLFDDDEGFVSTLISLAANTKRPIILIVNNAQVKHLSKLTSLCFTSLHFAPPSQDRLGSWLRTVSAVEGFGLSQAVAMKLASKQDIRRSLLQLQFSQEKASLYESDDLGGSIWERIGDYNLQLVEERRCAKRHMSSLATLDVIQQKKRIRGIDVPTYWQSHLEDSTLSSECTDIPTDNLDDYESYFFELMKVDPKLKKFQQIDCPRGLKEIEKTSFSMTNILSRRNNAMDFWPYLRQISRNEAYRLASHTKRNNRYFNYLSSVGISAPPDLIQSFSSTFSLQS